MKGKLVLMMAAIFIAGYLQFALAQNLDEGLVAYYPFNGNANDESGNGHDGQISGADLTADRFGEKKSAYQFSNNGDLIVLKNTKNKFNFKKSSFTLSAWAKFSGQQNGNYIVAKYKSGAPNSTGLGNTGDGRIYAFAVGAHPGVAVESSKKMSTSNWSHLVMVINDASQMEIYLNNQLQKRVNISSENFSLDNNLDFTIGGIHEGNWGTQTFKGLIDDVRIYNRALSENEVETLYELESTPPPPLERGLVAYYPFNGNANDESGNGNHGTVFSAENTADRNGNESSAYKVSKGKRIELPARDDIIDDKPRTISIWLKDNKSNKLAKPFVYGNVSSAKNAFGIVHDEGWHLWGHYVSHRIGSLDAEWRLHTVTYHNNTIKYYIDGALKEAETNWYGSNPSLNTGKSIIYIGNGIPFDSDSVYFDGKVDDIRIYNRALSESEVAALYELEKPKEPKNIITSQPQSGSFAKGSTITIKVGIDGSYDSAFIQWFKNGQPLAGENTAELTIKNADEKNGGDYYALISAGGKAETSETAKVTILSLPEITAISENTVADEGETIQLTVTADGTAPLSYKWKKIGDDSILSTSSNLVLKKVDEDDAGSYVVIVSSEGGEVTSPAVILGIRPDTDNDGLLDYIELDLGSDINKRDTDDDGISDFDEVEIFSTSPTRADTDGDGLDDGSEIRGNFDPRKPTESADGSISIGIAVELEFFTLNWNNYQLQRSKDLNKWQDVDAPFKGVGGYSSILQPARKDKIYWRLIIVD